jgi:hypothetical protein
LGVRLAGAARACFAALPHPLDPANKRDRDRIVTQLKELVSEDTFAAAREAGKALAVEEAAALASAGLASLLQEP